MSVHKTSYKIQEGEFGGEECHRLEVDHGVLITFDEVTIAGGQMMLKRDGDQKASLNEHRIPGSIKQKLRRVAHGDERPDGCTCQNYMSGPCLPCSRTGFESLNPEVVDDESV